MSGDYCLKEERTITKILHISNPPKKYKLVLTNFTIFALKLSISTITDIALIIKMKLY